MTTVTIVRSNGVFKSITVDGHAGFARNGKDIVCAAVSMLVINTINSIEEFTDDDFKGLADDKKGRIEFELVSEPSRESIILIDSMILGLTNASEEYGKKYLRLEFKEV